MKKEMKINETLTEYLKRMEEYYAELDRRFWEGESFEDVYM